MPCSSFQTELYGLYTTVLNMSKVTKIAAITIAWTPRPIWIFLWIQRLKNSGTSFQALQIDLLENHGKFGSTAYGLPIMSPACSKTLATQLMLTYTGNKILQAISIYKLVCYQVHYAFASNPSTLVAIKARSRHLRRKKCLKLWQQAPDYTCPHCNELEDTKHGWRCQGQDTNRTWDNSTQKFWQEMANIHTSPTVLSALLQQLHCWKYGHIAPDDINININSAITHQATLGWGALLEGRVACLWCVKQSLYFQAVGSCRSAKQWLVTLALKAVPVVWDLWDHQNQIVHQMHNNKTQQQICNKVAWLQILQLVFKSTWQTAATKYTWYGLRCAHPTALWLPSPMDAADAIARGRSQPLTIYPYLQIAQLQLLHFHT